MRKILFIVCSLILAVNSLANDIFVGGNISVSHPWARPTNTLNQNSAIYLDISNQDSVVDNLIAASTDVASITEIHKTIEKDGINHMLKLNKVAIPGSSLIKFAPGGLHIMLLDVKNKLSIGDKFILELIFEKSGKIEVEVIVKAS